ncbi:acyl-CoA thioesterase [Mycolicibacterium vaccae]|uniref:acyl-CoA thioesterase n=1 Tax=Mycolicibacterium vaccae TaxID=1810 RepID=UPI003CF90E7D
MADPQTRADYRYFLPITTRWMDNDLYGHVNNVTYYSYFDTVANHFLITEGGLDIHTGPVIGLVVESACSYRAPVAYPDELSAGLRVDKLGNRSVTYGIAIFRDGQVTDDPAVAQGHFVHVFVDRADRRAVAIPDQVRAALQRLVVAP